MTDLTKEELWNTLHAEVMTEEEIKELQQERFGREVYAAWFKDYVREVDDAGHAETAYQSLLRENEEFNDRLKTTYVIIKDK